MKKIIYTIALVFFTINCFSQQTIIFPSLDKVPIAADLYKINETATYIVLCHLSDHSRGEYIETAKRLNELGYNCLAIDTRTGNEIFNIKNQTAIQAKKLNKPVEFLDSEQDIIAAVNYADSLSNGKGIILFGSSFSASLALKIGTENPKVKLVIAFSPGEYFGKQLNLTKVIKTLSKPIFVTSSKEEAVKVALLIKNIKSRSKTQFIPKGEGKHGSISLWSYNPNNIEYWEALVNFLNKFESLK
ncbi:alpha/beta hydrolase [Stygiobacter electus]|uniref:Dienelactone hydrolase family protein n=1 Tax=Stygiobacter electus TaxID=3032292 RepID=A0AAE3P2K9_9BACT|nr:dienelactone hydrolase family protein [Stygiobacter electus]MDF1613274.1 dienelactone hydrolase family protein [Stygiobacter electus]